MPVAIISNADELPQRPGMKTFDCPARCGLYAVPERDGVRLAFTAQVQRLIVS